MDNLDKRINNLSFILSKKRRTLFHSISIIIFTRNKIRQFNIKKMNLFLNLDIEHLQILKLYIKQL